MSDKPADQRAPEPRYQGLTREQAIDFAERWFDRKWGNSGPYQSLMEEMVRRLERLAAAEPREGETQDDWSPGDIIDAKPDGTIVLDDGITTHNARRAKDYLAGKHVADRPAASQGSRDSLTRQCAEWLHLKMAAAQNLPYEDGDVCEECLEAAGEWISGALALAASQPPQECVGAWSLPKCVHGIVQTPAVICRECNPKGERCTLRQFAFGWEYVCSQCKHEFTYIPVVDPDGLVPHFCPNCGAQA